jgi:hypothetical protein
LFVSTTKEKGKQLEVRSILWSNERFSYQNLWNGKSQDISH